MLETVYKKCTCNYKSSVRVRKEWFGWDEGYNGIEVKFVDVP